MLDCEKMVSIPYGSVCVDIGIYTSVLEKNAKMQNILNVLESRTLAEWTTCSKRGWSTNIDCKEIAAIIGIDLPEIKKEED